MAASREGTPCAEHLFRPFGPPLGDAPGIPRFAPPEEKAEHPATSRPLRGRLALGATAFPSGEGLDFHSKKALRAECLLCYEILFSLRR